MTEREYNDCVNLYADNVYRFVVKNLRHEADAQDVVQSAFEKMWNHRDTVQTVTAKSYLFTIAYNQMIDHIRKVKRITLQDDFSHTEIPVFNEPNQLKKALHQALATLSPQSKSLVLLKDYEGYSYEEIGQIMNLTESQVKVYLHRARLQLRDYIVKIENIA